MPLVPMSPTTLGMTPQLQPEDYVPFYPDTALYSAPYPFPGAASYPGGLPTSLDLVAQSEGTETLRPLTEDG